jgi:HlyD family secretion protein
LQFDVKRKENVLVVPNAALRWRPQLAMVSPDARNGYERFLKRRAALTLGRTGEDDEERPDRQFVWVEDDGYVRPIKIRIGITDGTNTEVVDGEIKEGMTLVVGETMANGSQEQTINPFTPQLGNRKQQ